MKTLLYAIVLSLIAGPGILNAQDLDAMLEEKIQSRDYAIATFKGTRIVNGHSTEIPADGDLILNIAHRFGDITRGAYDFFGIDQATMRFAFLYGIGERLGLGVGRSTQGKTFDGHVKYKIFRQSTGLKNVPVTVTWFSGMELSSLKWRVEERDKLFSSRLSYVHQLLISRKFSPALSFQLAPALIHRNLVETAGDQNDVFALGAGGRVKLGSRVSFNGEYYYLFPGETADEFYDSFSLGFDIETGGHVFQIHITNAQAMFESGFIAETRSSWTDGEIYFGFNLIRVFELKN